MYDAVFALNLVCRFREKLARRLLAKHITFLRRRCEEVCGIGLAESELLEGDGALDFRDIGGEIAFEGGKVNRLANWASHLAPGNVSAAELAP